MPFPKYVKLVEVGPRDGLQNESKQVPTDIKIEFINSLTETGLSVIETTSFVSPKWIPQLSDHTEVFSKIEKKPHVSYPVFVPNMRGLQDAINVGVTDIAIFSTPSIEFCKRNINCTPKENLQHIKDMLVVADQHKLNVRGYISCVLGCPYEGEITPQKVTELASELIQLGCKEVSLGDTIGVGTPIKTQLLLENVIKKIPVHHLAVHFHDTFGQALANIYVALENDIFIIDTSVAGLGGCPYAKGASGNVATEDVLFMLNGMGIETNVDLKKLIKVGQFITHYLGVPVQSKVNRALK